jgi:serine/threonine-protein kinase RsbW
MEKIIKQAKIDHLRHLMEFVKNNAVRYGFSQRRISEIELATEEALMNIISYAYEGSTGDVEITCKQDDDKCFIIDIVDTGKPFDVFTIKEPDLTRDVVEREVGGLGIHFIKQFMDDIKYRREEDKNILTLIVQKD